MIELMLKSWSESKRSPSLSVCAYYISDKFLREWFHSSFPASKINEYTTRHVAFN